MKTDVYCSILDNTEFLNKCLVIAAFGGGYKLKENIKEIFENWNETLIWSCLQGIMGEIHVNSTEDAAMAILGDFAFCAGTPSEELLRFKPEGCKRDFIIMVPQNEAWAELIERCYGDKAKKVIRYAFKKEKDIFDVSKLEQAVRELPKGYELRLIEEPEYELCRSNSWANDLVSQFQDYDTYKKLGLGVVVLKDGELVAGASSYSRYNQGIEIEIDTREDHRRKGLAYACGAKLILECLKNGLYPSWDAQNKWSAALAEKLGYHFSHEYIAYVIMKTTIRKATAEDAEVVAGLAIQMWESHTIQELTQEFCDSMNKESSIVFLAMVEECAVGFAQCGLRQDYVEGTDSSPVGYLEGIFVAEEYRKRGLAKSMLEACQIWAKQQGCSEFASDCELTNEDSFKFHLKMGFEEANRIICFTKKL